MRKHTKWNIKIKGNGQERKRSTKRLCAHHGRERKRVEESLFVRKTLASYKYFATARYGCLGIWIQTARDFL